MYNLDRVPIGNIPLIPCPHCGGKASMIFSMFSRYAECLQCGAKSGECAIGPGHTIEAAEQAVTQSWNRRVKLPSGV